MKKLQRGSRFGTPHVLQALLQSERYISLPFMIIAGELQVSAATNASEKSDRKSRSRAL